MRGKTLDKEQMLVKWEEGENIMCVCQAAF